MIGVMRMRPRPLLVAVVSALALLLVVPGGLPGAGPAPAGAATATLRSLRTIDHTLTARATASGTTERYSSPAVGDLNKDDVPELVSAAPDGTVTATRLDTGAQLWQRSLGATEMHATPVIEDVDMDGNVDVVAATMDGRVLLLNGQNGTIKNTYRIGPPLHCPAGVDCRPDGFFATPAIGDVNGDGRKDIVAPNYDHSVYAWSVGGTLLWRTYTEDTMWSSPAIVDIDRNGRTEVVFGGDIWPGNPFGAEAGGLFWVLNGSNGSPLSGYPMSIPGQVVWSSPVITDLNGDGKLDAVVGTGTNYPDQPSHKNLYAFTLSNRQSLPGWTTREGGKDVAGKRIAGKVAQQPAVGDIDGDGKREVVVNTETGYLQAFNHDGTAIWSPCNANDVATGCGGYASHAGAAIADVDDDGVQEVVATSGVRLRVYDFKNKVREAEYTIPGSWDNTHGANVPAITEMGGKTVIVASTYFRADGQGEVVRGDRVRSVVVTTDTPLCAQDWPAFKGGPRGQSVQPDRFPWHPFPCGRQFVAQQYQDILGRTLDASGRDYWNARLRSGLWSGPRVIEGFMASQEFAGVVSPIVRTHIALKDGAPGPSTTIRSQIADVRGGDGIGAVAQEMIDAMATPPTAGQLVDAVYPRLLGRAPTASERTTAVDAIGRQGQGAWVATMVDRTDVVTRMKGRVQVAMTYIGLLDRAPDSGGWTYWVGQVSTGVSPQRLIEQFLNSPEYRTRVR